MGENTKIEWADHSWNPWIGCTKLSPACDNCYAEALMDNRLGKVEWGPHGERKLTSEANWKKPLTWDRKARKAGERHRVFCASLADVFDNQVPAQWRGWLFDLIENTPDLDWLLLTKRPQNIKKMLPVTWGDQCWWRNVWLGTTVENQKEADRRIPVLLNTPARVRFLSCEPLLGSVDLRPYLHGLDWVICGGESGSNARPMHPAWVRGLRDQCKEANVAFFFKQHGEFIGTPDIRKLVNGGGPGFGQYDHHLFDMRHDAVRVGIKAAGRLLDGVEHSNFPCL